MSGAVPHEVQTFFFDGEEYPEGTIVHFKDGIMTADGCNVGYNASGRFMKKESGPNGEEYIFRWFDYVEKEHEIRLHEYELAENISSIDKSLSKTAIKKWKNPNYKEMSDGVAFLIVLGIAIALFIGVCVLLSVVEGLSGVLTIITIVLAIGVFIFGPGVLLVAAVLGILLLELYLFAYHKVAVFVSIGILIVGIIIYILKPSKKE